MVRKLTSPCRATFVLSFISFTLGVLLLARVRGETTYDANTGVAGIQDGSGLGWNTTQVDWYDGTSNILWPNTPADVAIFGVGTGTANTVGVGTVTANGITFNPAASGEYKLAGGTITLAGTTPTVTANANGTIDSAITGSAGLIKSGNGILTLSNASNNYTGGTTVSANGGILKINNSAAALPGPVVINNGGTLLLNVNAASFSNDLSGAGTVDATSPSASGNLFLVGDLSGFTGTLDIHGGGSSKIVYGSTSLPQAKLISSNATIKVEAGNTFFAEQSSGAYALNFGCSINLYGAGNTENLGALRFDRDGGIWSGTVTLFGDSSIGNYSSTTVTLSGSVGENGGSFGLTKQGGGTIALEAANPFSGPTAVGAGTLLLSHSQALQNSTLTTGGIVFDSRVASHSFILGGLSGATALPLQDNAGNPNAVALSIGNNNASTTYSGNFSGSGSLTKTGNGVLTLSGINTYAGSTMVSSGTVRIQAAPVLPSGLKIMPIGDSITYGYNGSNAGYRGPLYNLLSPIAPGLRFVGSSQEGVVSTSTSPLPPTQRSNEGHSSYAITDIANNLDGLDSTLYAAYGGADRYPNGGHWFDGATYTSYQGVPNITRPAVYPDIITLMIGTNDLVSGPTTGAYNSAAVRTRLHSLISKITTQRPSCKVFIARITPSTRPNVNDYNSIVDDEVAGFQEAGKLIFPVDLNTDFPSGGVTSDGIHPNDAGFNWMALQWYNAIVARCSLGGGVAPAIPSTSPTTVVAAATLDLDGSSLAVGPLSGGGAVTLGEGGALLINSSTNANFSGDIAGTGSLTKSGVATQTLSGANTYLGPTIIGGGTLEVTGSIAANSAVTVGGGATLAGTGTIAGSTTLNGGGILAPGSSGVGTLHLGALALNGGSMIRIDLAAPASSDQVAVNGAYTAPSSGTVTLNFTALSGFGAGTYPVITGATGISPAHFTLGTTPGSHLYALFVHAGTLALAVDTIEAWRFAHFGTTDDVGIAADSADPDGDGADNADEFTAGTDPNDSASVFKITRIQVSGNDKLVGFPSVSGRTYRLEYSATLDGESWKPVTTGGSPLDPVAGTGSLLQITDTDSATATKRFYRAVVSQ